MVRGFIQGSPSGAALYIHRVSSNKLDPLIDDPKPISLLAIPSCNFFNYHGWRPDSYPRSILQQPRPLTECNATFMELHTDALQRCGGGYNPQSAPGKERPPLFEVCHAKLLLDLRGSILVICALLHPAADQSRLPFKGGPDGSRGLLSFSEGAEDGCRAEWCRALLKQICKRGKSNKNERAAAASVVHDSVFLGHARHLPNGDGPPLISQSEAAELQGGGQKGFELNSSSPREMLLNK